MSEVATLSKTEFATLSRVSEARVRQWIKEGKISGDALVGEGRFTRIRPELAQAQLRDRISVGQRFGNGIDTNLINPGAGGGDLQLVGETPRTLTPREPADPLADAIKVQRLRALEIANERAAAEHLAQRGRYVLADQAKAQMTRLAIGMLNVFEGGLADLASAISAEHGIPARDVLHLLRKGFREVRAKAAETARREAEGAELFVADQTPDASDPAMGQA
jgi:hypothetical protein